MDTDALLALYEMPYPRPLNHYPPKKALQKILYLVTSTPETSIDRPSQPSFIVEPSLQVMAKKHSFITGTMDPPLFHHSRGDTPCFAHLPTTVYQQTMFLRNNRIYLYADSPRVQPRNPPDLATNVIYGPTAPHKLQPSRTISSSRDPRRVFCDVHPA